MDVLLLGCIAIIALSGAIALLPLSVTGRISNSFLQFFVSLFGAGLAIGKLLPQQPSASLQLDTATAPWIAIDPLSAVFLVPIFVVTGAAALYGAEYCSHGVYSSRKKKIQAFLSLLSASLLFIPCARHAILFLSAWEVMALSAFFLVNTEDDKSEVRRAAWIYLIATHVCTLSLLAFFALYKSLIGSYVLSPIAHNVLSGSSLDLLYALALFGFGIKAGIYPLHFWLPPAHAAAPSHISAVMSGVLIKIGIYGILRCLWLLPDYPHWVGILLMVLGAGSAVLGVVNALAQHEIKRLLAYHSVENIGIIVLGIGLGLVGIEVGHPVLIALGFTAAFLHVWNHALFKSLLFLASGSIIHATGRRMIDRLGGLLKLMPYTSAFFLLGAVAIVGLPPLNGFVSEFILYSGLLRGSVTQRALPGTLCALSFVMLAFAGALALACFAKVFGVAFLGQPRTKDAHPPHECSALMKTSMFVLSAGCVAIGLLPSLVVSLFASVVSTQLPMFANAVTATDLPHLMYPIQASSLAITVIIGLSFVLFRSLVRIRSSTLPTWDCGFIGASTRLQYSASSFAEMLTNAFTIFVAPLFHFQPMQGNFPATTEFHSENRDPVMLLALAPAHRSIELFAIKLRGLQQGSMHIYVFYVICTLVLVLVASISLW